MLFHLQLTCFNPCYSGSNSKMNESPVNKQSAKRFNPCYSGSNSKMRFDIRGTRFSDVVSILVIVEVTLK